MKTFGGENTDFDEVISRIGTHSEKWDSMETVFGVSPHAGIAMWVADMDFRPPKCVSDAVKNMQEHGIFGYFGDDSDYKAAIKWWMKEVHGWDIEPNWVFTTHGLVNGTSICVDTFTKVGDAVVLFTPVYHAFARVIEAADRSVTECPLVIENGRYVFDFEAYEKLLTGKETMLILCSPHNPGGTVWMRQELEALAEFAKKHDLIIVSDEIHHDLIMPGQMHIPMGNIKKDITDRLVMMTAPTKTFNIAGCHTGNVIIEDPKLRSKFGKRMKALGISGNAFGMMMTEAAYSPEGAYWVTSLMKYIDENARVFDEAIMDIDGAVSMGLQSTYLAWVDFSGTGLAPEDVIERVQEGAEIAASHGATFGTGGETYLRFNIGMPRVQLVDAITRLKKAFA
ncbi:MalY/PatB family protein [Lentilitoribacter sp. Alg239-R112]|uniref:MalY/PatB family protein n=1 Tax=Lentilitoribacter sp. Alg239-R112 TaxID=2305987 RepID=UPI0013A6E295|nr:MalY/PatB family protein [Lentilitoribacter sp. Alg239-R112]